MITIKTLRKLNLLSSMLFALCAISTPSLLDASPNSLELAKKMAGNYLSLEDNDEWSITPDPCTFKMSWDEGVSYRDDWYNHWDLQLVQIRYVPINSTSAYLRVIYYLKNDKLGANRIREGMRFYVSSQGNSGKIQHIEGLPSFDWDYFPERQALGIENTREKISAMLEVSKCNPKNLIYWVAGADKFRTLTQNAIWPTGNHTVGGINGQKFRSNYGYYITSGCMLVPTRK